MCVYILMVCNDVIKKLNKQIFRQFLHNVNNPILTVLCKFQIDIPIDARVTVVRSLEDLHTFTLWQP